MKKEKLIEKLNEFENGFERDPEVIELVYKIKEKFDSHFNKTFSSKEIESDEFDEMSEEYYYALKENDPDDASIFQVMWFENWLK
jgi:hypothetical protein